MAFSGDAAKALPRIAEELKKVGYTEKSVEAGEIKMAFAGKWFTADPEKMKHSVTVTPGGDKLAFKFSTGLLASTWSDKDVAWAQARADEVVAAASAGL